MKRVIIRLSHEIDNLRQARFKKQIEMDCLTDEISRLEGMKYDFEELQEQPSCGK